MRSFLRGRSEAPVPTATQPLRSHGRADRAEDEVLTMVVVSGLKALAGASALRSPAAAPDLTATDLGSRAVRFEETTTGWFAYWAAALHSAPRPHRKLWEFAAVLQAMFDRGLLTPGARALGAGVGEEPIASCLANLGLNVTATDLPAALSADRVRRSNILTPQIFEANVRLEPWDVMAPAASTGDTFDIIWSCGLLSELGGLEAARTALQHSLARLRPGGFAFHTIDMALAEGGLGLDRADIESLAREQRAGAYGEEVAASFDLGDHPLDGYIDPPPFDSSGPFAIPALFSDRGGAPHLKALIGGRAVTSYLLILQA